MRNVMKNLLLTNIILLAMLSIPVQAAPIQVYATDVITTYSGFSATAGGPVLDSDAAIQDIIASDPSKAIYGSSATAFSAIDLGFGKDSNGNDINVFTGNGADLVLFSLWKDFDYIIGLQAFGKDSAVDPISNFNYPITACSETAAYGDCASGISALAIDLFGSDNLAIDDGTEISFIRLFIGGSFYNGDTGGLDAYSNFSLVGANYTDSVVVPLPLSAILFGSGLSLLGWVGRRKKC